MLKALEAPVRQIAENAGVEGSIVVGRVTESKSNNLGFDAQTEQYVDMMQAGIKPVRCGGHAGPHPQLEVLDRVETAAQLLEPGHFFKMNADFHGFVRVLLSPVCLI